MPKDKSSHALATHKCTAHSYHPYSNRDKGPIVTELGASVAPGGGRNDWKDATCPICLEPPHNAVLLLCSSHDKGCRPYMCNTSYRHCNCLDQYRKANLLACKGSGSSREHLSERSSAGVMDPVRQRTERTSFMPALGGVEIVEAVDPELVTADLNQCIEDLEQSSNLPSLCKANLKGMTCPFCMGRVSGWRVVEAARECLNCQARNCAQESCMFIGTYEELRIHARTEHPFARPSAVDPARQRDWRRLEQQTDIGDVLSSINSEMPSATIFGDYIVEEDGEDNDSADFDFPGDEGHWWTVFLLFQVFGPAAASPESSRRTTSTRLLRGVHRRDSRLGLLRSSESQDADANGGSSDSGEQSYGSSRRRRRSQRRP